MTAVAVLAALAVALFAVFNIASASPALVVSINDSDNVLQGGDSKTVSLHVTGDDTAAEYTVNFVIASNGVVVTRNDATTFETRSAADATAGVPHSPTAVATLVIPPSAEAGTYTITARATKDSATPVDDTLEFTVGDAGTAIGSVEVSLGKVGHSTAKNAKTDKASADQYGDSSGASYDTCVDSDSNETGDQPHANCVAVTVSVKNSLGEPANSPDVNVIHVFAPLGVVLVNGTEGSTQTADARGPGTVSIGEDDGDVIGATTKFFVLKDASGTVDVTAIVLGKGTATSQALTLTFTGTANAIELGDPSSPLSQKGKPYAAIGSTTAGVDQNTDGDFDDADDTAPVPAENVPGTGVADIEVTATDKAGNPASLDADSLVVEIADADGADASSTLSSNQRAKPNSLARIVEIVGTDAAPGTYTVTVKLGDLDEQTTEVVVAGKVANVEAEVSQDTVAVGDIITVTATVTDEDGNLQPDAGTVMFQAVGSLKLTGLGAAGTSGGHAEGKLDDGVAIGRYVVVDGSGTATIIASIGDIDGVTSVSTEAEEAMADEEASVACLSNLNGFSTWSCGVESSASEIFDLVSGRGATALHLWNGTAWVRYSVVDGTMVPGSSDFMVAENDILYISN